jgi:RHS repeat-associated protein
VTLPDGSFLIYTYDDARRLTVITNQAGEKIEFAYDLARNVTAQVTKDSGGTIKRTQTRAYDELSRLLRTIGAATQTTTFGYDNNSNLVTLTDPLNKATNFGFDALNRIITATNPLMGVRNTAYDGQDNVTSESDERSVTTTYVYNGFGEPIQEASPDGGTIVYVRNSAGDVTQKTDARGQVSTSSYDALNRITATTFAGAAAFNITYGYDSTAGGNYGIGRLTSVTDVSGQTALKYDHRGNVAREDRTIGGTLYTTEYKYDLADNLIEIVYPSGRILTYVRDALGRVTSVTTKANAVASPVNVATSIAYMPFGPIASLLHGNALTATFTWDQDYRLSGLVTAQGGTTIQNLTYGYNLADNVTSITDNLAAGRNQTFTLDDLQRLTSAAGAYGSITYTYDAADNRLTRNLSGGPSETFTYGTTNNRLQSAAVTGQPLRSFTTNAAGDITLDDRGAGNTVTIAIGADARPETITVAGTGATTVTYKHNAFGERVSRVESATTTHFHYDQDGRLLAESDGTGSLIREYLWLGDKPLGLVVGPAASATLTFVHADHLERVQKITDAAQAIVWDGQFTPYGRTHAITGTVQNPLRFPGQWADPAANYFYNYMRDYDPTLGRYLGADPLGTRGGRHKYVYAAANPQNNLDRSGAQAISLRGGGLNWVGPLLMGSERVGRAIGNALGRYLVTSMYGGAFADIPEEVQPYSVTVPIPDLPAPAPKLFEIPSVLDIPPSLSRPLEIDPERACGGPLTRPDPMQMAKGGKQNIPNEYSREAEAEHPNDPEKQREFLKAKEKLTSGEEKRKVQRAMKWLQLKHSTRMK